MEDPNLIFIEGNAQTTKDALQDDHQKCTHAKPAQPGARFTHPEPDRQHMVNNPTNEAKSR